MQLLRSGTIVLFFLVFLPGALAQHGIEGLVTGPDGEPLAFVNVGPEGGRENTSTDIDGRFKIKVPSSVERIIFSYVGYKTEVYTVRGSEKNVRIILSKLSYDLGEVEVRPGENPAHRIIRRASANRKINDPGRIASYTCQIYSKTYYDLVLHQDELLSARDSIEADSLKKRMLSLSDGSHVLLLESVTERKYLHPGNLNETVLATKVSGFKDPSFSTSATELQPFGFYGDHFSIIGRDFISPLAPGSTSRYFYSMEDTLYQDQDSVFVIFFRPLKNKKFEGLEGLLYIHTHGYAVQNVIASPHEKGLIDIRIQQQYKLIGGKRWFPEQLNYELNYKEFPSRLMGMKLSGKSYVTELNLDTTLHKRDFSHVTVSMEPDATRKDERYWELHRLDTLSLKEKRTYVIMDSLGKIHHFDRSLKVLEALTTFQVPVSIFNIDLNRMLALNEYEVLRTGIGLHTNDRLSPWFSAGAYIGYGFGDSAIKYGGDLKLNFEKGSRENYLMFRHAHDLSEPGQSQYFYTRNNINRKMLTWRMDHIEEHELSVNGRVFRHFVINGALNKHIRKPMYNYIFLPQADDPTHVSTVFRSTEFRIKGRFAYKEKLVRALGQMLSEGSEFPVLYFSYTHGFKTPAMGDFHYDKLSAGVERSFLIRHLGRMNVLLEGGILQGHVPYPYLFNGNGSSSSGNYLYVDHTFQTMQLYEFVSDRYINLFFAHRFASPFFRKERSQPQLSIHTNVGYGSLSAPEKHSRYFQTMEKGFYESGLFLDNILRANYFNISYIGLGGGVFMRYGPYAYHRQASNFSYKLSLRLSF